MPVVSYQFSEVCLLHWSLCVETLVSVQVQNSGTETSLNKILRPSQRVSSEAVPIVKCVIKILSVKMISACVYVCVYMTFFHSTGQVRTPECRIINGSGFTCSLLHIAFTNHSLTLTFFDRFNFIVWKSATLMSALLTNYTSSHVEVDRSCLCWDLHHVTLLYLGGQNIRTIPCD